ncbi:DUF1128 domain-containing protein [Allobacillus sp. GCM10007491]|uniref:DUF1128 domain-containing protein n=2 Tax=Allobacillus TaxID=1400133 RepID=A0A941CS89_9BACI|nr:MULTISPECIES: DUF1128 domain-containing protein [Allobacillus]MBR7552852.1 DUF1128 domain-containing protein [Allobacillus saliphilus]TSJ67114.1 DUF1128 domain-containing protein [Allobacillus salarius]
MNLNEPTEENLEFIINDLSEELQIINRSVVKPENFDLANYQEIKDLYDMVKAKRQVSVSEIHAIIDELKKYRKN